MAILSTILAISEPSGFWVNIIKAFEGFSNNYVLAIILLTVIIRLIWAPIDTLNRRMSMKMSLQQAKMKPELDRINKKYANDPKMLKQKQNELYQKNNSKSMGSCAFMFIFLALNMLVFFTLFSGLNQMAAFKIAESYDELKFDYANALVLTDNYLKEHNATEFADYENLYFKRLESGEIALYRKGESEDELLIKSSYGKDFSSPEREETNENGEVIKVKDSTNVVLKGMLDKINAENDENIVSSKVITDEDGTEKTENIYMKEAFQNVALRFVKIKYNQTKDNFLWIDNIWIADSPFEKSVFTYKNYVSKVGTKNVEAGEEAIYNAFMIDLRNQEGRVNGYLILTVLCIGSSFLSVWLSSRKKKGEEVPAQANGKFMKFIMPCIFGIFALFYNSVFAIYMFVSQLISALLIPLQNLIINKWQAHDDKKEGQKKDKVVEVDYRRKF